MPTAPKNHITHDELRDMGRGVVNPSATTHVSPPAMVQVIIIEVISDPVSVVNEKKKQYWKGVLGVGNMKYADVLPRNTIIGQELGSGRSPLFCFPFFPSHLSMPSKAGEVVWAMHQNPNADYSDMIYWMCKVVQPHFVDDVNHTHMPRIHESSYVPGTLTKSKMDGKADAWNELRNGPVQILKVDGKPIRVTSPSQQYITSDSEDIFEKIVTETDAGKITQYEAVPRFKKRPGDLVLEGSNNSLIVLGTDRSGPAASYSEQENQFLINNNTDEKLKKSPRPTLPNDDMQQSAGSIDLVVGRGQTTATFGSQVSTTRLKDAKNNSKGSELKKELDKVNNLVIQEGDPDYVNDRSRLLIAQRTKVDQKFGLSGYNNHFQSPPIVDQVSGSSAVVIKTDKVRIVARSDIQIVMASSIEGKSPSGQTILQDDPNAQNWASITLKSNGDIVFKPSKEGYIKLGGDDAKFGVVCSDVAVTATNGTVSGGAIVTTMGGQFAGSIAGVDGNSPLRKNQGKFASKVLIK